jgi:hypothetical protein
MTKTFRRRKSSIFRSGLEEKVAGELAELGVAFHYEPPGWVIYQKPNSRYKPDFVLPNGIIVETKGQFLSSDRSKHKLIKAQNPALDIRFVFSNSRTRIGSKSKTTYAMWCERLGFQYADKSIPSAWIKERLPAKTRQITEGLCKGVRGRKK